ncbi:hypothetical protein B0H66DRAFT_617819 [Apodospora peruviana]|uniref:CMP/dCMP-type deaminase domain-containing protein n=1 Tax=Apodospora peruviana TaxID=516989 RepID=A0AAE0IKE9_9PEZI|nr:hypothetical protein B0H66DRAFT_617819 [Apodospora peruviana]
MPTKTDLENNELIKIASKALSKIPDKKNTHTIVAAVCSTPRFGRRTFVAVDVDHFNGGACAELVVLGAAAAQGALPSDIKTIVAVLKRPGERDTVVNSCGRCRQVLLDYNPDIKVVVMLEGQRERITVLVSELLPFPYFWTFGDTTAKKLEEEAQEEEAQEEEAQEEAQEEEAQEEAQEEEAQEEESQLDEESQNEGSPTLSC